jgi:hypothetical protein
MSISREAKQVLNELSVENLIDLVDFIEDNQYELTTESVLSIEDVELPYSIESIIEAAEHFINTSEALNVAGKYIAKHGSAFGKAIPKPGKAAKILGKTNTDLMRQRSALAARSAHKVNPNSLSAKLSRAASRSAV